MIRDLDMDIYEHTSNRVSLQYLQLYLGEYEVYLSGELPFPVPATPVVPPNQIGSRL